MSLLAVLSIARRFWWSIPIIGLTIALVLTRGTLAHTREELASTKLEYAIFRAKIVDNTAEALIAQKAITAAQKDQFNEAATQADAQIGDLRDDLRAARLRATAVRGPSGGGGSASEGGVASVPAGLPTAPGGVSESVCMTGDVADGLAAYSIASHNFAKDLVARGVGEFAPATQP